MRQLIFVLCLIQLFSFNVECQGLNAIYSQKKCDADCGRIIKKFGGISSEFISERDLRAYLKKNVFNSDPNHDSIVINRIYEAYYYNSGNSVGAIHNWLKLLSNYSSLCDDADLEYANRKVAEAYFSSKNYLLAREFFKKTAEFNFAQTQAYVLARIGSTYLSTGDIKGAIPWYQKAIKASILPEEKVAHTNSLGYVYFLNKEYKLAEAELLSARDHYFKHKNKINEIQLQIIRSNLASLYLARGQHDEGVRLLTGIMNTEAFERNEAWLKYEVYSKLLQAHMNAGDCAGAEKFMSLLETSLPDNTLNPNQLDFLRLKINWLSKCHGGAGVSELFELYKVKEDSIRIEDNVRNDIIQNIQRSIYNDQIALISANLKLEEDSAEILALSNSRLWKLFLISGVLFVMVVFFFVLRFRKNKLQQDLILEKEKSTELQIKVAEQEMENKKLELSKILTTIDRNSSLSDEVLSRLSALKSKEGDVKEDISQIIQFINSMSRSNTINELVEKNSDALGFGLKERLEKQFPNLTPSELQLVVLVRLGLTTKEIAQLKNIEPASVRIFKHRLKTKLGIPKDGDLNSFIRAI